MRLDDITADYLGLVVQLCDITPHHQGASAPLVGLHNATSGCFTIKKAKVILIKNQTIELFVL